MGSGADTPKTTLANAVQVGGEHYRSQFQHWDWVIANNLGYLEGCATKYIARWRKKNGLEDLLKARHYLDKLIEVAKAEQQAKKVLEGAPAHLASTV
jgi:hypothetical protein